MIDRAVSLIQQLGFTANEARAYTTLLTCQPVSAYELARRSGIPTSKIYEIVEKLVAKEIIRPLHKPDTRTQEYMALSAEDFMARIRQQTLNSTTELLPLLLSRSSGSTTDLIWPLGTPEDTRARAIDIVTGARQSLLLSLWPEELDWLFDELLAVERRGIPVAMVHFGKPDRQVGATYHHPVEQTLYEEKGGRGLTLVADSRTVLIANYRPDGSMEAEWSRNQSFVTVAEDYIRHDVYITKVTRFLDPELKQRFGENYERLRDVFRADA